MSLEEFYLTDDAIGLAQRVARREVSARELLEVAITRLERLDPLVHAVPLRWLERARRHAESLPRGPLRGVPFLLKDLYVAVVGERLTNGSRLFRDQVSSVSSALALRYERAGLQLLGRSASPELGITTSTESRLYGATRNPWSLEHIAGGSSGGAAAAVAAGIVPAAHASDGGGSIRIPASCCGLFGLKPTRARVSLAPSGGEGWNGLSVNHAVTRSVRDSALLLDLAAGYEAGDPYCAPHAPRPYLEEVQLRPKPLRVAISQKAWNGAEVDPVCLTALANAAALCEELGHHVEPAHPEVPGDELSRTALAIVAVNTMSKLLERGVELGLEPLEAEIERQVEPLTWITAKGAQRITGIGFLQAIQSAHAIGRQVASFFQRFDVLLTPTMACQPLRIGDLALDHPDVGVWGRNLRQTIAFTQLMNVAGNPAMSVPLYWSDAGLPIGVQFSAAFGDEPTLLRLAAQLEQARPWSHRRPPVS
jgi:Asp-tRNA(Asn)/Glu-tRNA(Gln) amidotransferase A subunit family amidase